MMAKPSNKKFVPMKGFKYYEINRLGVIRSIDRTLEYTGRWGGTIKRFFPGKIIKPQVWKDRNGITCVTVSLYEDDGRYCQYITTLMAKTFMQPFNHKYQIRHLNGDSSDCRLSNLYYSQYKKTTGA